MIIFPWGRPVEIDMPYLNLNSLRTCANARAVAASRVVDSHSKSSLRLRLSSVDSSKRDDVPCDKPSL